MITHQKFHGAEDIAELFRSVELLADAAYMASPAGHESDALVTGPLLNGPVILWADYVITPAAKPGEYVLLHQKGTGKPVNVVTSGDAGDIAYGMRSVLLPLVTAAMEGAAEEWAEELAGVVLSGDQDEASWVHVAGCDDAEWWPDDGVTSLVTGVMEEEDGSADVVCAWGIPSRYVARPGRDGDPDPLDPWLLTDEDAEWGVTYGVAMPGTTDTRAAAARVLAERWAGAR